MAEINEFHAAFIILALMLQAMMLPGETFTAEQFDTGISAPDSADPREVGGFVIRLAQVVLSFPITFFQLITLSLVPGIPQVLQAGFTVYSIAILGPPAFELATDMATALGNFVPFT